MSLTAMHCFTFLLPSLQADLRAAVKLLPLPCRFGDSGLDRRLVGHLCTTDVHDSSSIERNEQSSSPTLMYPSRAIRGEAEVPGSIDDVLASISSLRRSSELSN
jgi:hypothetical protein